jgi:hypothetical protein
MVDDFKTHVHKNGLSTEIAALTKASRKVDSIKSKILVELEKAAETGLTPDEFVFKHGGLINTIRRRFTDLWKEGKIKHHPSLLTRKNSAGNDCVTWVLGRDMDLTPKKPQRQPLTDEEIGLLTTGNGWSHCDTHALALFARAIERAHGIGGEHD